MESLVHADIFFFITTLVVVGFAVVGIIAGVYVIQILRHVRHITEKVREESDEIVSDVRDIREAVEHEGWKVKHVLALAMGFLNMKKSKKGRKKDK